MKLYLIRNKEGKFFRAIGYGGHGGNWVELERAKFYIKMGQAKSRVTFFSKNYPNFGIPDIIECELSLGAAKIIDMKTETVGKLENQKRGLEKRNEVQKQNGGDSYIQYYQNEINALEKTLKVLRGSNG